MTFGSKTLVLLSCFALAACNIHSRTIKLNSGSAVQQQNFYSSARQILAANGFEYKETAGYVPVRVTKTTPAAISHNVIIPPKDYEVLEMQTIKSSNAAMLDIAEKCLNSLDTERYRNQNDDAILFEFDCKNKEYVNITSRSYAQLSNEVKKTFDKLEIGLKTKFSNLITEEK